MVLVNLLERDEDPTLPVTDSYNLLILSTVIEIHSRHHYCYLRIQMFDYLILISQPTTTASFSIKLQAIAYHQSQLLLVLTFLIGHCVWACYGGFNAWQGVRFENTSPVKAYHIKC